MTATSDKEEQQINTEQAYEEYLGKLVDAGKQHAGEVFQCSKLQTLRICHCIDELECLDRRSTDTYAITKSRQVIVELKKVLYDV